MLINVAGVFGGITNSGPGRRVGVWVSGCSLRCPGCFAPELWEKGAGTPREVRDVVADVLGLSRDHDGITISGGEPFEQASAVHELIEEVAKQKPELDVLVYTGYTIEEIRAGTDEMKALLGHVDVLIDGRFRDDLPTDLLWRGSANQRMNLLSARAKKHQRFREARYEGKRPVHFEVTVDGRIHLIGIPERGFTEEFVQRLAARGITARKDSSTVLPDRHDQDL